VVAVDVEGSDLDAMVTIVLELLLVGVRVWTEKAESVDGRINVESNAVTTLLRILLQYLL
jgi:hypothetical protein